MITLKNGTNSDVYIPMDNTEIIKNKEEMNNE